MNELCKVHRLEWKVIPAGVSKKTGKPYNSFKVCPEAGCREKPMEQPRPQEDAKAENQSSLQAQSNTQLIQVELKRIAGALEEIAKCFSSLKG